MSKSIRSYPKAERQAVVVRRLAQTNQGLGYLAAKDYGPALIRAVLAAEVARKLKIELGKQ